MTLAKRRFGRKSPGGLGDTGCLVFAPSHRLGRNSHLANSLLVSLSLFEGSPTIQSLLIAAVLLLSGTGFQCLKALMPWSSQSRIASPSYASREN